MKIPVSSSSISNLFPEIIYDNTQSGTRSLDIWNSYRIVVLPPQYENEAVALYTVKKPDTLPSIAYEFYKDPQLWWMIPLINDVEDPFDFLDNVRDGSLGENGKIKLLKSEHIDSFLFRLRSIKSNDNIQTKDN